MGLENFIKAATFLAKNQEVMRIRVAEPTKEEFIYIKFNNRNKSMALVDGDDKEVPRRLANKLWPFALAVLVQVYQGEQKKKYAQTQNNSVK